VLFPAIDIAGEQLKHTGTQIVDVRRPHVVQLLFLELWMTNVLLFSRKRHRDAKVTYIQRERERERKGKERADLIELCIHVYV